MNRRKNGIQKLIGFETFTKYGVRTDKCEFAFFHVEPTNISVLSAANIEMKIHQLTMLLSAVPELELIALDSCECFDTNKSYVRKRMQEEPNEAVRRLLEADYDFLGSIQTEMSSAREFLFVVRFSKEKEEQIFHTLNRVEKAIADHGFLTRRMGKADTKRLLALYFGTSISGEEIDDVEGEQYMKEGDYAEQETES